ncbi:MULTISPECIES: leucine-rich repeat protein [unclassified Butyrivibrio]|uniref:leucine-rich repeat protein n=1 Tax=unclassified Butyrivibrio TaxID=2639466 RepID=UPI0004181144|nr:MULTISPECIES: leucine-rich repeat protein [unclassified Butyrivibrio]
MKKGFLMSFVVGMILLLCPLNTHAMGGSERDVSTNYNIVKQLIDKQVHPSLTQSQIDEYYEHFMTKSDWRPGQVFPYPNAGSNVDTISDGKYTYSIGWKKGCYAYSKFINCVVHGGTGKQSSSAKKNSGGWNTPEGIKELITKKAQFGEHIVISDVHSVTFLACDDNGIYGLEFWENKGSRTHLVYYTYEGFAEGAGQHSVFIWDAETAENILGSLEVSNPRVVNLNSDGFDIAFDLKNASGRTDLQCNCCLVIWCDSDVSWKGDLTFVYNESFSYDENIAYAHFAFGDDLTPTYITIDGRWYGRFLCLPRTGIERGPYLESISLGYKIPGRNDQYWDDFYFSSMFIDIRSQLKDPKEGEEVTESDNGGNTNPDDTPIGDENASKDPSNAGNNQANVPTVNTSHAKKIGETFNLAYRNYKVVGDREIYLIGVSKKDKKVHVGDEMTINGITYRVTGVAAKAFKGNTKLTEITIGENVEVIGKGAFQGCKNLKTIKIKARNLRLAYKNSFAGTNKEMKVWVRFKNRLKKYKKLIAKSGVSKNTKYAFKKF